MAVPSGSVPNCLSATLPTVSVPFSTTMLPEKPAKALDPEIVRLPVPAFVNVPEPLIRPP